MTRRVRCGYCPAAAVARVDGRAAGVEGGDFRSVACCQVHLSRARSWCVVAGLVRVESLPGGWVQLSLDGDGLPAGVA